MARETPPTSETGKRRKCVALLSGGLDSILAVRLMQEQGIEVEALNFQTVFTCCQDVAGPAASELNVRLTVIGQQDDYLDLVQNPRFGYGRGANPCVDCRIYMFDKARQFMEHVGAQFIVSGEVVGQRPMSQKRRDLLSIAYHSDLEDLLLRPLSARLLPPTLPEREGWVDREQLFDFSGRGRKPLIALANELGIQTIPTPSTGCALTEPQFSKKVFDLITAPVKNTRWDFELLKVGRHFRRNLDTKVVVGRNETENSRLCSMHETPDSRSTAIVEPDNFAGPCALLLGPVSETAINFAAGLVLRYGKQVPEAGAEVRVTSDGSARRQQVEPLAEAERAQSLGGKPKKRPVKARR